MKAERYCTSISVLNPIRIGWLSYLGQIMNKSDVFFSLSVKTHQKFAWIWPHSKVLLVKKFMPEWTWLCSTPNTIPISKLKVIKSNNNSAPLLINLCNTGIRGHHRTFCDAYAKQPESYYAAVLDMTIISGWCWIDVNNWGDSLSHLLLISHMFCNNLS